MRTHAMDVTTGTGGRADTPGGELAMHDPRPIFIVGSPRSGTSVLTWSLGQHPDLLLTEESNWLGSFATQAAVVHAQGSARGLRSQLGALGITREAFLSGLGETIDRMILAGRSHLETVSQATALQSPEQVNPEFAIVRDPDEAKTRWVDGTPEYSLQIQALLALFPKARFVHLLRDVDQVAASLLAFRNEQGRPIVDSAEAAYAYWMRTTQACVEAESILGPGIIRRVRHADLAADSEGTLRGILEFLGEPFSPACLEPLQRRINSSFPGAAAPPAYPHRRTPVIEEARLASEAWLESTQPATADASRAAKWQAEFETAVLHLQGLETHCEAALDMLKQTRLAFAVVGVLLLINWLFALARLLQTGGTRAVLWLALASTMVVAYLWLRRSGVRSIAKRVLGMTAGSIKKPGQ